MPRIRKNLTAYPELRTGDATVNGKLLKEAFFKRPPWQDQYRTTYGRSLSLDRIQSAILMAQSGYMRDLTDMARETMSLDPHLTSVLFKRLNSVASLPWEVRPAEGPGVNKQLAQAYCDFVREQLMMVSNFRQAIVQLAWGLFDGRAALENHWVERHETYEPPNAKGISLQTSWRIGSLAWIHPRRLQFGPERELRINDTMMGSGFEPVGLDTRDVAYKFITFMPQLFGDYPELEGLAPKCLYWSFMKRFGARERMVLVELFGKPWRIITVSEESDAGKDDLIEGQQIADQLGNTGTARMPRGVDLKVESPDPKSGDLHEKIIETSDKQISKLVLGQTGTTDAQPGALGGGLQAVIMSNEQFVILAGDAAMLSEAIEDGLTDAIIEVNFGRQALINAPRFVLRAEQAPDKKAEAERMKLALDMGLPIMLNEAYELLGFKMPEPGSIVLQVTSTPGPMGTVERSSKIMVAPDSLRAMADDTKAAIDAAMKAASAVTEDEDDEEEPSSTDPTVEPAVAIPPANSDGALGKSATAGVIKDVLGLEASAEDELRAISRDFERLLLAQLITGHVHGDDEPTCVSLSKNRQPDSVHGSIETLIDKGVKEGARVTQRWASMLADSVRGLTKAPDINRKMSAAAERLDLLQFARTIERRITHSSMTGSLDSQWEDASGDQIAPEKFDDAVKAERARLAAIKDVSPDFTSMAYKEALNFFKSKTPIPKSAFEKLSSAAKARSFTVAGLTSEHMLRVAQDELAKAIVDGTPLTKFSDRLTARFKDAGLTPLNTSHLETVFRTNLVGAYNVGRKTEMTQPDALKLRPYWQIRTVKDDRQRRTHGAVDGWVLRATDPFWRSTGGPPWGFNCRCRTTTIRATKLGDLKVRSGAEIRGLPDDGFDSVSI